MRLRSSAGVSLAVHHHGGDGPPLLLAHATGFHGRVFDPLAAALADRFACWSFDFRAHGDSPAPDDGDLSWARMADDVAAVVDGLGLDRPLGLGHSMGGACLLLAEQARPGTFGALWCYEPIVFDRGPLPWRNPEDHPLAIGARRRRDVFGSRDEAYGNYSAKPPFSALAPGALRAYVDHGLADRPDGTVRLKCRPDDEAAIYMAGPTHDAAAHLAEVACPTTVACGNRPESPITPETAARLADRLAVGRVELFDHLGHFGPLEDPPAVAAAVDRDALPWQV